MVKNRSNQTQCCTDLVDSLPVPPIKLSSDSEENHDCVSDGELFSLLQKHSEHEHLIHYVVSQYSYMKVMVQFAVLNGH